MSKEQAELRTGLTARAMDGDHNDFLRCQLGRITTVTRPDPKDGRPIAVGIFHLFGFGRNWRDAARRSQQNLLPA